MHTPASTLLASALVLAAPAAAMAQTMPTSFVDVATVVPGLFVDMRYAGTNNFVGRRIDGYEHARCLLTREAATTLAAVQNDLAGHGLGLKVFDCYRPARAVAHFVRWAKDLNDTAQKSRFYPEVDKQNLFRDGYIAARSGHSRGSTVDLTLVHSTNRHELDMGTGFDLFSPRSWPASTAVTSAQHANRMLLASVMTKHGFKPLEQEWWHFTLAREPFPETYFDFPVK
jgi:D-alanyl-D-alanine dipeptidase